MECLKKSFCAAKDNFVAIAEKTKCEIEEAATKTRDGVVNLMAQKTTEEANIVTDTAVAGANEVVHTTVEGVESALLSTGMVTKDEPDAGKKADL